MNIAEIPFVKKVGIKKNIKGEFELPFSASVHNHLQTILASAQFTLAETASGEMLQTMFPELIGQVIPLLRDSKIKFKKPATQSITAFPSVSKESLDSFNHQWSKKRRGSITVNIEIKDTDGTLTCTGSFNWFIQNLKKD